VTEEEADKVTGDLGILFHAKEFPKEFRFTSLGPTYPIGDPVMGGLKDPRKGTKCSTTDQDFFLRNYVWLLSTNTIYVVDTRHPDMPAGLANTDEFHTVHTTFFAKSGAVFDCNYFPPATEAAQEKEAAEQKLQRDKNSFYQHNVAILDTPTETALSTCLSTLRGNTVWLSYVQSKVFSLATSMTSSTTIYICPLYRRGVPVDLKLAPLFTAIEDTLQSLSLVQLEAFGTLFSLSDSSTVGEQKKKPLVPLPEARNRRVPLLAREYVNQLLKERRYAIELAETAARSRELDKLRVAGYADHHAEMALEKTASTSVRQNMWSSFRAENLLTATHPVYRTPSQLDISDHGHDVELCHHILKQSYSVEVTLEVINAAVHAGLLTHSRDQKVTVPIDNFHANEELLQKLSALTKTIMHQKREAADKHWAVKMEQMRLEVEQKRIVTNVDST
jgi:hypothetical protein